MSETIESPSRRTTEQPVPDPNLFFLRKLNQKFVAGETSRPLLVTTIRDGLRTWYSLLLAGIVLVCVLLPQLQRATVGVELPRIPQLPGFSVAESTMLAFLAFLFLLGVLVVVRDYAVARTAETQRAPNSPAQNREVPVKSRHGLSKSQIIDGTVVQAEKIRRDGDQGYAALGVRYQFAAPGGVVTYGYAEGFARDASSAMAPMPGTPVKVYYRSDKEYYLL